MNSRTLLLASVAAFAPLSPVAAQQASPDQQNATPAPSATPVPQNIGVAPAPSNPVQQRAPGTASTQSAARPASARAAPPVDEGDEEDIVITGSRPRGSVVGDIPPEDTLDARDVRATGATNINDLLDALAPQIGSVRGRGGEAPVLLLNGERISSFRELRDIPTEAILRVEILPEEVALKYGYGADQKVVNIVLRQRFRSTTAQLGAGGATEGGYVNEQGDLTRFLVQRNGRTTLNLHYEGNNMLTEAERNVVLTNAPPSLASVEDLADRSLVGTKRDIRASSTFNRQIFGNVSATLNTEVEHNDGLSYLGLNPSLLDPLARYNAVDTAHAGMTLSGQTRKQWHWNVIGNADLSNTITKTDESDPTYPRDRARETTETVDISANANGNLFKLPAGYATTTLTLEGSTEHLSSSTRRPDFSTQSETQRGSDLSRSIGKAKISVDLPISRKGHDFSALGNLTLNGNALVQQLSDFGTLTTVGAGVNLTPIDRVNLLASVTREEGPPTVNQLGDPVISTPGSRVFDFTTNQTVLVTATTGGNPNLRSDRRNVLKLSGNWQPFSKVDLRFRVDYVHQTIAHPISDLTVTPTLETAFPGRFMRNSSNQLVSVNLIPVNFAGSTRDQVRIGLDFTHPLKSHQPSQSVLQQMRQQLGFGPRGPQDGTRGAPGAEGPPPGASPAERAGGPGAPGGPGPDGRGGGGGFRGGRGGGGGGGGGGLFGGGNNRGRIMFDLTDTITFVDKVLVMPGGPTLDYLHGDAAGATGGTPRHDVQAQLGYFNNGLGARLVSNWRSATTVYSPTGDNLHFASYGTFDLKLFANLGDIPEVVVKHPWLRGTQLQFNVNNAFNARPLVHDAAGNVPLSYQPDLLDPLGRTIMITFRKLFLPSPAFFRRQFQQERQQQQSQPH